MAASKASQAQQHQSQQKQTQQQQARGGGQLNRGAFQGQDDMEFHPAADLMEYWRDYARHRPEMAALWCFGIGFVLGWKLKPW